jgi:hypothetical protein
MTTLRALAAPAIALATLSAAGCAKGTATPPVVERDSAGVAIIEHSAAALQNAPAWTTGAPTVTVAGAAGDQVAFARIVGGTRLSDGRILVVDVDNGATRPLLFAKDGTLERPLGRPGNGPGEFRFAWIAGIPGDTIVFYDMTAVRVTTMLPDGTLLGTRPAGTFGPMDVGVTVGRLADGRIIALPFALGDSGAGDGKVYRARNAVTAIDPARQSLDTLSLAVPSPERFMTHRTFGGQAVSFPAPAPYGSLSLVAPAGDRLIVATNETPEVVTYALPWQARRIVRFARTRLPVDAGARAAYIDYNLAEIERRSARLGAMKAILIQDTKEARFPDSMGYYSSLLLATDSSLWVAEMRSMADSTPTHLVLGSDGHLRARVSLPPDARLLWAGADEVLLVLRDQDDVERLELRPIIKPGTAP